MKEISFLFLTVMAFACVDKPETKKVNPEIFNLANSDPAAVELADSIVSSAGGEMPWKQIRFVTWMDGKYKFYWDKLASTVRIEDDSRVAIINVYSREGEAKISGNEVSDTTSLRNELAAAYQRWRLSSDKLFITYMLKQPGNSLHYFGEEIIDGKRYNLLHVNFNTRAGESKYILYVDLTDNRIKELRYFRKADQSSPTMIFRYDEYQTSNGIIFSVPSGSDINSVQIGDPISESMFTEL